MIHHLPYVYGFIIHQCYTLYINHILTIYYPYINHILSIYLPYTNIGSSIIYDPSFTLCLWIYYPSMLYTIYTTTYLDIIHRLWKCYLTIYHIYYPYIIHIYIYISRVFPYFHHESSEIPDALRQLDRTDSMSSRARKPLRHALT